MKLSFYLTLVTMTGAAVCALGLLKNTSSLPNGREHTAQRTIDYSPTGSTAAIEQMKALQKKSARLPKPAPEE
jgi:hypothetical protein